MKRRRRRNKHKPYTTNCCVFPSLTVRFIIIHHIYCCFRSTLWEYFPSKYETALLNNFCRPFFFLLHCEFIFFCLLVRIPIYILSSKIVGPTFATHWSRQIIHSLTPRSHTKRSLNEDSDEETYCHFLLFYLVFPTCFKSKIFPHSLCSFWLKVLEFILRRDYIINQKKKMRGKIF